MLNSDDKQVVLEDFHTPGRKSLEIFEDEAYSQLLAEHPCLREISEQGCDDEQLLALHENGALAFIMRSAVHARNAIDEAVLTATTDLREEIAYLKHELAMFEKARVIDEVSEGLTLMEAEKFAALAEFVPYTNDRSCYREILARIKAQHFSRRRIPPTTGLLEVDDHNIEEISVSPQMRPYLKALEKTNR